MSHPFPLTSPSTSTSALPDDQTLSPDGNGVAERHRSIQFADAAGLRHRSATDERKSGLRRIPSPPPPSAYQRGVSFDTFDNRDATDFSLTLNYKHKDYQHTRRSRTFLCGTDQNDYSEFALEWLLEELVDDGDEVVCLRVVEKDSKIASEESVEEGRYRQEAEKLLESAIAKNAAADEKAISLVMELAVGKVHDIIQRMIQIYEPAVLIVGTRGRSLKGMQGLLPGSVSKYCLQQSPIPVIVVRPSIKREKKKQKRLADPTRKSYNNLLRLSEARGSKHFDTTDSARSSTTKLHDDEASEVAKAIGVPQSSLTDLPSQTAFRSANKRSSEAEADSRRESVSSTVLNPTSPTSDVSSVAVKSPTTSDTGEGDHITPGHDDGSLDSFKSPTASGNSSENSVVSDNHDVTGKKEEQTPGPLQREE
ncbi:hypothetical protein VTO42DRAFT_8523 [Malbranchea cinnamomea]